MTIIVSRENYLAAYYKRRKSAEEYEQENIYIDEEAVRAAPTSLDIAEVCEILKDFGVRIKNIPHFETYADLQRWKNKHINQKIKLGR